MRIAENLPTLVPEPASSKDSVPYHVALDAIQCSSGTTESQSPAARDSKKLYRRLNLYLGLAFMYLKEASKFCRMAQKSPPRHGLARWH